MEQYLDRSESLQVEIEELLGPEESEIDIRHSAMNSRAKQRRRHFQIFSGQGPK